jgi:hypothetical protein
MVVSPQHFTQITNGYEQRTDGLWVHKGNFLIGGTLKRVDDTGWLPLTLASPWLPFGAGWSGGEYRKDATGWVHVRGLLNPNGAVLGTPIDIAILPAGFRPGTNEYFTCTANASQTTSWYIVPTGQIRIGAVSVAGLPAGYYSWSGISFQAEN